MGLSLGFLSSSISVGAAASWDFGGWFSMFFLLLKNPAVAALMLFVLMLLLVACWLCFFRERKCREREGGESLRTSRLYSIGLNFSSSFFLFFFSLFLSASILSLSEKWSQILLSYLVPLLCTCTMSTTIMIIIIVIMIMMLCHGCILMSRTCLILFKQEKV